MEPKSTRRQILLCYGIDPSIGTSLATTVSGSLLINGLGSRALGFLRARRFKTIQGHCQVGSGARVWRGFGYEDHETLLRFPLPSRDHQPGSHVVLVLQPKP